MSTVIMQRGNTTALNNLPNTDGLIFFNSDDLCIYLDNGSTREVYGGKPTVISTIADATTSNFFSAQATVDNFCAKVNVADTASDISNNTAYTPVGCRGFNSVIGTSSIANVGTNVKTAINNLDGRLTVNSNKFYFDYKDGKWGFNTSSNRGADTFHPFNSTSLLLRDSNTQDWDIEDDSVSLYLKSTTVSSQTALPINFYGGSAVSIYWSQIRGIQGYGDVIHIFDDRNGSPSAGGHKHYVFDTTWHECTNAPSPLKSLASTATIGLPFGIKVISQAYHGSSTVSYDGMDDLYFYVCVNNMIKIYRYTLSAESGVNSWTGTWIEVPEARFDLGSADANSYQIGTQKTMAVYKNELHLIGGTYKVNGVEYIDTRHFIWNPRNKSWRIVNSTPSDIRTASCGLVVHSNKIFAMCYANSEWYCYAYNGTDWSTKTTIFASEVGYSSNSAFVEYNGEIHWFGGTTHPTFHVRMINTKAYNPNTGLFDAYDVQQYTNLDYQFLQGCAILQRGFTTYGSIIPITMHVDDRKQAIIYMQDIHLLGTSKANTSEKAFQKYHRKVEDNYKARIANSNDYIEVNNT